MASKRLPALILVAVAVAACNERERPVPTAAPVPSLPSVTPAAFGPVLGPDGRCQGQSPAIATVIEPGIGECELVRLKGKEPTDVLVGESGKGQREVQVLYSEPGGREIYLFVNNRLDRIVK